MTRQTRQEYIAQLERETLEQKLKVEQQIEYNEMLKRRIDFAMQYAASIVNAPLQALMEDIRKSK